MGFDVEGSCQNTGCPAHGLLVINLIGMGSFIVHASNAHCPECHAQVQPKTCVFTDCHWTWHTWPMVDERKVNMGQNMLPVVGR